MITRLAPTPSGFLHKGNIFNFLLNWLWARANGGAVLLRIDDADTERKRKEYVEDIFFVLQQLGMDWDIGPSGPEDFEKNWSQVHREKYYFETLKHLTATGNVYTCCCSRTNFTGEENNCACREKSFSPDTINSASKIHAGNIKPVSINGNPSAEIIIQDFVVRKKDGKPAYPVTSLTDDKLFGVTHIARGEDLLESTARQLLLDSLLPNPGFHQVVFKHHPLISDEAGIKLSKSAGTRSKSMLHFESPDNILREFARWMKWDENNFSTLKDMITHPSLRVS